MNKKEEKLLAQTLAKWFKENYLNGINFFNQNDVAKVIKTELKKRNRWKNFSRGKGNEGNLIKDKPSKEDKSKGEQKLCECGEKLKLEKDKWICSDYFCAK